MAAPAENDTRLLNVDLDVYSRSDLRRLAAAFGNKVQVLHVGRERGLYSMHLELNRLFKSPEAYIRSFATLIKALPTHQRQLWDGAIRRDFNIGVQAATAARPYELPLSLVTMEIAASVGARIILTLYAPSRPS